MPTAPGLGLKFDQATIDRYRAACNTPSFRGADRRTRTNHIGL